MSKGFVNFKKNLGKVAITSLLVGATTVGASAATKEAVTTANLNMRNGEGTNHKIVTTIPKGEKVSIVEDNGSWWKIKYQNKEGYSYKNYLRVVNSNNVTKEGKVSVGNSRLNVRTGAGTNYRVLGKLSNGDIVKITGESGSWYEINYKGQIGFVSKKYVKNLQDSGTSDGSQSMNKVMKVNTKGSNLNVRSGAGTGYSVKGKVSDGSLVTVLEKTSNGWYKISYKGGYGFISGAYLTEVQDNGSNTNVQVIGTAIVKTNGSRLNVRKGQGTNTSVVAKLGDGVKVELVKDDNPKAGWTKVKVGNVIGYVSSQYLSNRVEKPEVSKNEAPVLKHPEVYYTDKQQGFFESDLLEHIKARDKEDGDISNKIKLSHNITGEVGEYSVKISVTDSKGVTTHSTIKVVITDTNCVPNQAPTITAKGDLVLKVGDKFDISMLNIKATDDLDGDLTKKVKVDGTVNTDAEGTYELVLTVEDKHGAETVKKLNVKVVKDSSNSTAPVIECVDALTLAQGDKFTVDMLKIKATDKEDGDLTKKVDVKHNVNTNDVGTYTATITVTDKQGAKATKVVKIIVEAKEIAKPNTAPVISSVEKLQITQNDAYSNDMLKATATDKEGDKVTITYEGDTVKPNVPGTYTVIIKATDAKGAVSSKSVVVTVVKKEVPPMQNNAPVLTVNDFAMNIHSSFNYNMLGATATDKDGDKVTITYKGDVKTNKVGTYRVTVTATDAKGAKTEKIVNVKVNATNPTVKGNNVTIKQGQAFNNSMLGASATDCEGKAIAVEITGDKVDTNRPGTYTLVIKATDQWGLTASKSVTVTVEKKAETGMADPNSAQFKAMVANEMYALVNAHREANGKAPLQVLGRLEGMANAWSKHMADTGVFDHVINGKDADETFPQFGDGELENIALTGLVAKGETLTKSDAVALARDLFDMWKNSAGHNNSMLDGWNKTMGFGFHALKKTNGWEIYATQEFYAGTKSIEKPVVEEQPQVEEQQPSEEVKLEEQQAKPVVENPVAPEQPKEEVPQVENNQPTVEVEETQPTVEIQTSQPTVELN